MTVVERLRALSSTPAVGKIGRVPWRTVVLLAVVATMLATAYVLYDASNTRALNGWLIHVGPDHPSRDLIVRELPEEPVSERGSHDGAQFYAIARFPLQFDVASTYLDQPRYRLQRPLYPWLAAALHPWGGGEGLVWAFFVVGVVGLFLGAVATGALSTMFRGPPWPALLFPILPGSLIAMRITVPDHFALALALAAIVLSLQKHHRWAVVVATLAVLTREPIFLVLLGFGVWRRDRPALALVGIPALVAALWAVFLRFAVPERPAQWEPIVGIPFSGLRVVVPVWLRGEDPLSFLMVGVAFVIAVAALIRRRLSHPLSWAVLLNLAFFVTLFPDAVGPERNGPRIVLPLLVVGIIALVSPGLTPRRRAHHGGRELSTP